MGIFGRNNGTDGLPPLGDDKRRCHTSGCGNPREHGLRYCKACQARHVDTWMQGGADELANERAAWSRQPSEKPLDPARMERELPRTLDAAEVAREQELTRAFAAPLFPAQHDPRCFWCCKMRNERAYEPAAFVHPTVKDFECGHHYERRWAHRAVDGKMQEMRTQRGMSTSEIAHYFRYGYLGEYLNTGTLSDYDGDHSDYLNRDDNR